MHSRKYSGIGPEPPEKPSASLKIVATDCWVTWQIENRRLFSATLQDGAFPSAAKCFRVAEFGLYNGDRSSQGPPQQAGSDILRFGNAAHMLPCIGGKKINPREVNPTWRQIRRVEKELR